MMILFVAGLVNWMATLILVEGKIFEPVRNRARGEYSRYFVGCHLCTGTWVGIAEAVAFTLAGVALPFAGWFLVLANALAIKAVGHLILVVFKLGDASVDHVKSGPSTSEPPLWMYDESQVPR